MSNKRNGEHSNSVVLFGALVMIAILAAAVVIFERGDTRTVGNETPLVTTGLAKPHPPGDSHGSMAATR